ncbi:MAG: UDP-glucose/GDP-mannose dehydrogenase family protein [Pirellulaceae bacterium]|nr:UDP-glucose/GDP-mannose dehydrogenase family protein [Pirellulaceae bacterium]
MKITVVGTGYVGLVTGTCFAESGNEVTCVDIDAQKIAQLKQGEIPIYEPGLGELVERNAESGRLQFTTDLVSATPEADLLFLAVGTPQSEMGTADLTALWAVVDQIAPHLCQKTIVVVKSTVPVGTNQKIYDRLRKLLGKECRVASNPEFLKEGAAIQDFQYPDRVVVGIRTEEDRHILEELYAPFLRTDKPFLSMSPESAELTKYTANCLLSTKISFINEIANIAERIGADINEVRRGIGHDERIGFAFMFPGVGYGGSCFPKDVLALSQTANEHGIAPHVLQAVHQVNQQQKETLLHKVEHHFHGQLRGKTVAVWGLSFKPKTDDIREAPALVLIDGLLNRGVHLQVHDPVAMKNVRQVYGDRLTYAKNPTDAVRGADCLAINTEWGEFRNPSFETLRNEMTEPVIFDGRNLYHPEQMKRYNFTYYSIGRPPIFHEKTAS